MVDLNKEGEDNAEPPELHCCKHCAKDVALHIVVVFVSFQFMLCCYLLFVMKLTRAHETRSPRMFWMESPVKDLCKFCPDGIYKWFMYNSFVLYFVNSAPIENREYLDPLVFCSISPIEKSALQILSQSITRNLTELQALTDVFSRSSRIVPDPLKHKFRVAWWGRFLWNPKKDFEMIWLPMISQTSSSPTARRNPYTCQNISKQLCFFPFLFF